MLSPKEPVRALEIALLRWFPLLRRRDDIWSVLLSRDEPDLSDSCTSPLSWTVI